LEKSRKWIIREGLTGISRSGSGAPIAWGWKKSLGFLTLLLVSLVRLPGGIYPNARSRCGGVSRSPQYLVTMDATARDSTEDWLLPEQERPPLIGELTARVEEALATARASEAAVISVGAAALDAAEQARRAAELAERASVAAVDAQGMVASAVSAAPAGPAGEPSPEPAEGGLSDFSERADRLVERLRQLQRVPLGMPRASGAAERPQPAS
jgi:hypothetical protein